MNNPIFARVLAAGFSLDRRERFSFRPTPFAIPVAPRILRSARPQRGG
jgi:hypothetical protein